MTIIMVITNTTMNIITTTTTDTTTALLRLMAWLSPVFPVGSFSYSHGLERAVHDGLVTDMATMSDWLRWIVTRGSGWNDVVLCAESWRRGVAEGDLVEIAELAEALAGSRERHMETMLQGEAFRVAARSWPSSVFDRLPVDCPYPVAVGAIAGGNGISLGLTLAAFLQAFCINLLQASIRLSVMGQNGVTATMADLEPVLAETAARTEKTSLSDLGSATCISDIMAMKHETQHSRLFRT